MPHPLPWIQRKFSFTDPVGVYPDIIERCRGVPARIEDRVRGLPREVLTGTDGGGWSIQQNIGHLLDLEALLDGRIDDFLAGEPVLRAADMQNRATIDADHNTREIGGLLAEFRAARERIVGRLESLTPADFGRAARHPRLDQPMRLVDAVAFACAHDDYHLARISELIRGLA